ncbi:MAG: hypothetical protein U5L46_14995 [Agrobacterium sp.]|nr:hypothetical protein [Agrobacterium sp.]
MDDGFSGNAGSGGISDETSDCEGGIAARFFHLDATSRHQIYRHMLDSFQHL